MDSKKASKDTKMPWGIWALGFVSLLADIASEIIHYTYLAGTLFCLCALIGIVFMPSADD
ncbi:hypothetical protein [Legionella waltersii]|uniref:Major facilitator superfamily transporter n=2 Tax=Legionella waltersii TaxID=66969 RepID=A0A0W1ADL6_9GAMM|nr:hypothetical protein [Legionella waltersii]KTD79429.1 major facilitator superfamily transporter [Legionella waltersii]SNU97697.1 major facilitator superfamily transporter [Legionella waltersii]